jgi:hypothetical protein
VSYNSRKKKRAVRRARKRKVGLVSADKADSRELYYAKKGRQHARRQIEPCS